MFAPCDGGLRISLRSFASGGAYLGARAAWRLVSESDLVTWSPSVTLVPTRGCFNACAYCSFRLPLDQASPLSIAQAEEQLRARPEAAEVLLLSGEVAPGSPERRLWFHHLRALSALALVYGRLPHTNAGPLSLPEMASLGRLNPSMGLMLEGVGPAYDALHRRAPSKSLEVRIGQLEQAGRLGIPFTTGLLLGVGETMAQREQALELLAGLQRRWGHLQEVILQPWRPDGEAARPLTWAEQQDLLEVIAMARQRLPQEVHLQTPPNLWPLQRLPQALEAGISDLGGIDSLDVINPAYPQPSPADLCRLLQDRGWRLEPRTCVHRGWWPWLPQSLRRAVEQRARLLASAPA